MPIYEYRCESCGAQEEKLESFSAPTEHECVTCNADLGMKRQVSVASFSFSGGGWYASDYSKKAGSSSSKEAGDSVPVPTAAPKGGCCGGSCACSGK